MLLFSQQKRDQQMLTIDSLIAVQNTDLASALMIDFVKDCGGDCPKSLLARKEYLRGLQALNYGLPDSALRIAERWIPRLNLNVESEQSPYYSMNGLKGACQQRLGKLDDAYTTYSHLRDLELEKEKPKTLTLVNILTNLGNIDIYRQQFHKARITLLQASALAIEMEDLGAMQLASCLNSLSYIARSLNEQEKAIDYLEEAIQIMEQRPQDNSLLLANPLLNLGILIQGQGKAAEALPSTLRAYHIFKRFPKKAMSGPAMAEAMLGSIYADLSRSDSAKVFLSAAETSVLSWKDSQLAMAASVFQIIGEGYMKLGDFASANSFLDEAMQHLGADPDERQDFSKVTDHRALHYVLMNKLENYQRAQAAGSENNADSILFALDHALALYKYLQQRKGSYNDRQITTELAFPLIEKYLEFLTGQEKPPLEKVFELMELGKARLLVEKIQQEEVIHFAGITDSITALEQSLEKEIEDLQEQIRTKLNQGKTVEIALLQQHLEKRIDDQESFLFYLKREHPAYHNLKYVNQPISLAQAQTDLEDDEAQLSYFVGNSSVFLLLLRKDFGKTLRIKLNFPLRQWAVQVRSSMYSHKAMTSQSENVAQAHVSSYCRAAYGLYDKLVRPIEEDLPLKTRIIPDGDLSFIPFEVLLSSLPDQPQRFRNLPYLIHRFQFSYSFSSTLHHQLLQDRKAVAPKSILVVAPTFPASSRFKNLPYNQEEASKIQAVMGGEILQNEAATAQAFREKAAQFRILHIASHAKSDDQYGDSSYIAFSPVDARSPQANLLYARDIYGIPMRADMVVLSACETALGEWQTGEGILGLNRACMYAGAKSTVTSLWQVDDSRTSILISWFYEGLHEGLSKDAALRQAKLKYLRTYSPAHPYYWASFIAIGNMTPILLESNFHVAWWILIIAGLLLLGYGLWRRRLIVPS